MNLNDGITLEEKTLRNKQMSDYYSFVFPELDIESMLDNELVIAKKDKGITKFAVDVPPILPDQKTDKKDDAPKPIGATPVKENAAPVQQKQQPQNTVNEPSKVTSTGNSKQAPKPILPAAPASPPIPVPPAVSKSDIDIVNQKLSEIYKILDGYVSTGDLEEYERRIENIFNKTIDGMESKLESFKRTVVPPRKQYESDALFKKNIYENICIILDDILLPLFNSTPDYTLNSFQSTQYFKDGSIANALVCINVDVLNGDYKYTFQIDVPVLNGVINAPTYIRRSNKLVPLIKSEIQKELSSFSYQKAPVNTDYLGKDHLYDVNPVNMAHKENTQDNLSQMGQSFKSVLPSGQFKSNIQVNRSDEFSTNSPKYPPKF